MCSITKGIVIIIITVIIIIMCLLWCALLDQSKGITFQLKPYSISSSLMISSGQYFFISNHYYIVPNPWASETSKSKRLQFQEDAKLLKIEIADNELITIATRGDVGNNWVNPEMQNFQKPPELPLCCFVIPSKSQNHLQISSWWSAIDRFIIGVPGRALFINIYVCHLNIVNCPPPTQQQPSSVPQTCNIESLLHSLI